MPTKASPDAAEVAAIVEFFEQGTDADRFCGLGVGATLDDVTRRFGPGYVSMNRSSYAGTEASGRQYGNESKVQLGRTSYTCLVEVFLFDTASPWPFVDVRLVRDGFVQAEIKAARDALTRRFQGLYGKSMRFERAGVRGEVWLEVGGIRQAMPAQKLGPAASLRVRVAPIR